MQPAFVSAAKIAATLTPALRATDGVITITGVGDHLRPEWPITITGMRRLVTAARKVLIVDPVFDPQLPRSTATLEAIAGLAVNRHAIGTPDRRANRPPLP